jgi:hypothetical protein
MIVTQEMRNQAAWEQAERKRLYSDNPWAGEGWQPPVPEQGPSDAKWKAILFYLWFIPVLCILRTPLMMFFAALGR